MAIIDQDNSVTPIPFRIFVNGGDYRGAPGLASQISISLSKSAGEQVPAKGEIKDVGGGAYWLMPNAQDADTPGSVAMIISAPAGYIVESDNFCVRSPSLWSQLVSIPGNIAKSTAYLKALANSVLRNTEQFP